MQGTQKKKKKKKNEKEEEEGEVEDKKKGLSTKSFVPNGNKIKLKLYELWGSGHTVREHDPLPPPLLHFLYRPKDKTSYLILSNLSRSLADRWGTTVDFTTSFLHSSRFSAFRSMMFHSRPVHSLMLSSHRFLCLPLRLPPWTVPRRVVLASPDDRVTCPNHFSLRLFTVVKRSSYSPMAFPILAFTSSLVMWSLYEIPRSLRKHLISNACILLSMSAVMVHVSHAYKNMDRARERISLILELMAMFLSFQMTFSLVTAAVVWAILPPRWPSG